MVCRRHFAKPQRGSLHAFVSQIISTKSRSGMQVGECVMNSSRTSAWRHQCALVGFPAALWRSERGQPIVAGSAAEKLRRGTIVGKIANPTE
jgi:hypothetical protein